MKFNRSEIASVRSSGRNRIIVIAALMGATTALLLVHAVVGGPVDDGDAGATDARAKVEAALSNPRLDPAVRGGLEGKIASLDREAKERAARPTSDVRAKAASIPPTAQPSPTPFTGVYSPSAPWSSGYAMVTNAWAGSTAAGPLTVFAGTLTEDPEQAFIEFDLQPGEGKQGRAVDVPLPRKTGKAHIESAQGTTLVLFADDGSRWLADVVAFTVIAAP
jgi:hypothetical protein